MFHSLLTCGALLAVMSAAPLAQTPVPTVGQPGPPVVVAEGDAIVKRAPDRAWLTLATETREPRVADARRRGAEAMTALQAALRAVGVPADAIRTTGFTLMPEMEWDNGRGTVRGYLVRNQIEVRVDDLDKLGEVIEAANSYRSTSVSLSGPRFDLKDRAAAERDALRQAVEAAVTRAQAMAAAAKGTLGAVVRIDDRGSPGGGPEPYLRTMAMRADAVETPISPGDIEVRGLVSVTFELR
jgi:uncharacterized protein YggE